ncbi:MAG: helical backbone metal receptor [Planctomycetota bacterium]
MSRLVAVTRYCVEPPDLPASIRRVGGTKNPDLEAIAALDPDLVLVNREENRMVDIEWLSARFPVLSQGPSTIREAALAVVELGKRLGARGEAEGIRERIECSLALRPAGPRPSVFYAIWRAPWMTVTGETYAGDVLREAGALNVAERMPGRYPRVPSGMLESLEVDLVLLSSEPYAFGAEHVPEASRCFGPRARVLLCDGKDFCWHGARTPEGLRRARALLARARSGLDPGAG